MLDTFLPGVEQLADIILETAHECLDDPEEITEADALRLAYQVRPIVLEKVLETLEEEDVESGRGASILRAGTEKGGVESMTDDWHDLPEELRERRPLVEQVYHRVSGLESVEQVREELEFALSELADWREEVEEKLKILEEKALEVHALQLKELELRHRRKDR